MSATDCVGDSSKRLEAIRNQRMETIKNINLLKTEYEHVTRLLEEAGISPEGEHETCRNLGRKKFSTNPKMGLEFLFENHILERDPVAVAKFFLDEKRTLSKSAIGSYLGEISKEFNLCVLEEYVKLHEFTGQDFLPALRNFLFSFQLPGESQKIDKILSCFAHHYVSQNPSAFHTSQDAYVLAYAAILLNTTLHNTNARSQNLSLADEKTFIQTMLDFDKETNLSEDIIRCVYQGIKSKPIQLAEESNIMCGWLWKLGKRVKIWKRRWFVLTDDFLFYYTAPDRMAQRKGIVALENVCIRRITNDRSKDYCFELFPRPNGTLAGTINTRKADREGIITTDYHATYRMAATNAEEFDKWVSSLQLITKRLGLVVGGSGSNGLSRPLRGSSVPCFTSTGRHVDTTTTTTPLPSHTSFTVTSPPSDCDDQHN